MPSIEQYRMDIQRYNAAKAKINVIAGKIRLALEGIGATLVEVKTDYQIWGGEPGILLRINQLKVAIEGTLQDLEGTISALDTAIQDAWHEIAVLEEQERQRRIAEAEARRQQEEEARKQQEEARSQVELMNGQGQKEETSVTQPKIDSVASTSSMKGSIK